MNNAIQISQVSFNEHEQAAELFNEYRMFYQQASDVEGAKAFLWDRLIHRDSVIFIAKLQSADQYVVFMQLFPSYSSVSMKKTWILNDLYVREEYRGHGYGKLLLDQAKQYAQWTEAKGLALATAVDNEHAQKLYEQYGYKKDMEFYHYFLNL